MSSSANNWAVIVAAGRGVRFGSGEPKQFAALAGKPLVLWSVEAFRDHPSFSGVTVVLPPESVEMPPTWLERLVSEHLRLAAGGAARTDSVRLGLATVPDGVGFVAVHDGVRPLISTGAITRVLEAAGPGHGAVAARRVTDSLKESDAGGRVLRAVDRENLWRAETPQVFPRGPIIDVHRRAAADQVVASDCAGLCERYGLGVVLVEIDDPNPKVTHPRDLRIVEALLAGQDLSPPARPGD
ncbi:MAG: 2-C-methyl-D-erythritol 4-phosphate cytidylyltransferase [Gemmatimonadota bacterium]|nr:MAG: 2-C-methyl-D-erythritol 4-phosphate cytidylyltransferase [Gemmatimonadota bacterium]